MADYQLTAEVQSPKTTVDGSGVLARYLTGGALHSALFARAGVDASKPLQLSGLDRCDALGPMRV